MGPLTPFYEWSDINGPVANGVVNGCPWGIILLIGVVSPGGRGPPCTKPTNRPVVRHLEAIQV